MVRKSRLACTIVMGAFFIGLVALALSGHLNAQGYAQSDGVRISTSEGEWSSEWLVVSTLQQEPVLHVRHYTGQYNDQKKAIKKLSLEVYSLQKQDLLDFLTYTDKRAAYEQVDDYMQSQRVTMRTDKLQRVTTITKNDYNGDDISLPIGGQGVWLVRAIVDDQEFNDLLFVRSDIGAMVKEGENSMLFWSQHITSGKRLTQGTVEVYNLQDKPALLNVDLIDQDGAASTPSNKRADLAVVTEGTSDLTILPINYPEYGSRWAQFYPRDKRMKYYLFTDRPLYRPGDVVHFKSIIRDDNDAVYTIPGGMARVRIFYGWSQEHPILDKNYAVSAEGTIAGDFTLPEAAQTGTYQIEIANAGSDDREYWLRTVQQFQVEQYRKPEYFLDSSAKPIELIKGDTATFDISGSYFFGQPLSGASVKAGITATQYYDWWGYDEKITDDSFYDYWYGNPVDEEHAVTLDAEGHYTYTFDTSNVEDEERDYYYYSYYAEDQGTARVLTMRASHNDESGNRVTTASNVLMWPGEYSIYRTDYEWGQKVGQRYDIPLALKAHNDISLGGISLNVAVDHQWWEKEKNNERQFKYDPEYTYVEHHETLPPISLKTDAQGKTMISFIPKQEGSYRFSISGKDRRGNTIKRVVAIWVYDPSEYGFEGAYYGSARNYNLSITSDKTQYKPGENAQLTIATDQGSRDALLTVEREYMRRYQVVSLNTSATDVSLPIVATDMPDMFVAVSGFSVAGFGTTEKQIDVPADSKHLQVDITYDHERYAPGETVRATVTTKDEHGNPVPAELAVWTVDKALYELMTDRRQDIFEFFWNTRYNETAYDQSLRGFTTSGGAEKGCFAEGTMVLTPSGEVPIERIKAGDTILTHQNASSSDLVRAHVVKTFEHTVDGYLIVNGTLKITPEHRLWVSGAWKEAGDIQVGDTLIDEQGNDLRVTSVEWQKGEFKVYNLSVAGYHTFIAGGIWVHNDKGGDEPRSVFKDVAYWNPSVHTNAQGVATISFTLPDNLTTWVLNAVAATAHTDVGEDKKSFIVTKPVIMRPTLPNYVRTGDTANLSVLGYNYQQQDGTFAASCTFGTYTNEQNVSIAKNQFAQIILPEMRFEQADPDATFSCRITDTQSGKGDAIILPLPVRPFGFDERMVSLGEGDAQHTIALEPDTDRTRSSAVLTLSASIFGTLPQAMEYLLGYPYGCIEQTTSRFVPAVIAKENEHLFAPFIAKKNLPGYIDEGVKKLAELQNEDGGWGWWGNGPSDPLITAYAAEYLVRAQQLGVEIPGSILINLSAWDSSHTIYATANLTREERLGGLYVASLLGTKDYQSPFTDYDKLPSDLVAFAVLANVRSGFIDAAQAGGKILTQRAVPEGEGLVWKDGSNGFFWTYDGSTALAVRALVALGDLDTAYKGILSLSRSRTNTYWSNTFATAQTLDAMTAYANARSIGATDSGYQVTAGGQTLAQGTITDPFASVEVPIDLASIATSTPYTITIDSATEAPLFSSLVTTQYRTDTTLKARNGGLRVYRTYEGKFIPGETVTVHLTVIGDDISAERQQSIVIEDYLPSGLVPVNTVFESERGENAGDNYYGYYDWGIWNTEYKDDGAIFAYRWWDGGRSEMSYRARVVSRGTFTAPPAVAELMYAPEVSGRSPIHTVRVDDAGKESGVIYVSDPDNAYPPRVIFKQQWWRWLSLPSMSREAKQATGVFTIFVLAAAAVYVRRNKRSVPPPSPTHD